jgi:hypothetical protein
VQDSAGTWKLIGAGPVKISAPTLGDALAAFWPFEDASVDATGNGFDLTPSAGNAPVTAAGKVGNALQLDGRTAVRARLTGIASGAGLSFGAWVFLNPNGYANETWILAAPVSLTNNVLAFALFVNGNNTLQCQGGRASTTRNLRGWHHAVCTVDPDTMLEHLYVDGVEAAAPSQVDGAVGPTLFVGGIPPPFPDSRFFAGMVDEAFLANRALSSTEIQTLMSGGEITRSSVKDFRVEEPDANTVVLFNDSRQLLRLRLDVGH